MKLSVCIDAVFEGVPVADALVATKRAGIDMFEFWCWWEKDLDEIRRERDANGLEIAGCCTKFISLVDPTLRTDYLEGLKESIAAAKSLDVTSLVSQVGDELPGVPRSEQHASLVAGLKDAAPMLEEAGVTLLVEPLNVLVDHAGYYLTTSEETFEIMAEVDSPNVKVVFDIYHQQITEGFLAVNIEKNIDQISYFHAAGVPGRHEVFGSEINYPFLMQELDRLGYEGGIGLEYWPAIDAEESLRKTVEYLGGV